MNNLMIDLETLSTASDAAIISIGACYFELTSGEIGETFCQHIVLKDTPEFGHISADTVKWWLLQNQGTREAVTNEKHSEIQYALQRFGDFCRPGSVLWSNGSSFDLVILRNAYLRCNYRLPWDYWAERDVRTIVDLARMITGIDPKAVCGFSGDRHNALNDAVHQAKYTSYAFCALATGDHTV